jgi:hypothetical protein
MVVDWTCASCQTKAQVELEVPLKASLKTDFSMLAQCSQCLEYARLSFGLTATATSFASDHLRGLEVGQVWHASGTERSLYVQIVKFDSDDRSPIWIRTFDMDRRESYGKARRISYEKFYGRDAVMQKF